MFVYHCVYIYIYYEYVILQIHQTHPHTIFLDVMLQSQVYKEVLDYQNNLSSSQNATATATPPFRDSPVNQRHFPTKASSQRIADGLKCSAGSSILWYIKCMKIQFQCIYILLIYCIYCIMIQDTNIRTCNKRYKDVIKRDQKQTSSLAFNSCMKQIWQSTGYKARPNA